MAYNFCSLQIWIFHWMCSLDYLIGFALRLQRPRPLCWLRSAFAFASISCLTISSSDGSSSLSKRRTACMIWSWRSFELIPVGLLRTLSDTEFAPPICDELWIDYFLPPCELCGYPLTWACELWTCCIRLLSGRRIGDLDCCLSPPWGCGYSLITLLLWCALFWTELYCC